MFTHKDLEYRTIFVINCIENKNLRVQSGELLLEDTEEKKTLTKLPFQKILALFVVGHITVTTPLIEKCTKYGVPLVVMKPNLRPVFFHALTAEGNFLLRQRQHHFQKDDLSVAAALVMNKISNQLALLEKTRLKNASIEKVKMQCSKAIEEVPNITEYEKLMGMEGRVAKSFFGEYFKELEWTARCPRTKIDPVNTTLDIGYTILFNYIEAFARLFGFDPYVGVYHRLWFKRKSLICDLMEPFRCIIDRQVRKSFNTGQCKADDFKVFKNEFVLKHEKNGDYMRLFYDALIPYKMEIFLYMRDYYRCFMQQKGRESYPQFCI